MKNKMYKLLLGLCLLAGFSCSQSDSTEEAATTTTNEAGTATEDTAKVSNEVPESLQHH